MKSLHPHAPILRHPTRSLRDHRSTRRRRHGRSLQARDLRLQRIVAIKILPDRPDARERFDREARAVSSLNHPRICALYDVGHQDGIDFLVMEYVEGETLFARLGRGPLPLETALRIVVQTAEGLAEAHRCGIVHRDLKPANVMLTGSRDAPNAKLLDFGVAKIAAPPSTPDQ